MRDQATELRNLVLRAARIRSTEMAPAPRLIAVAGGRSGVGVTSLAVNLSAALAELGARVVLVDVDFNRPAVAARCQLSQGGTVADVMNARRDIHEVLQLGPNGVLVVPAPWTRLRAADCGEVAQHRLLRQCQTLGRHADVVILDAGSGTGDVNRRFWQSAADVVLVTTPEPDSIMDAYVAIKAHAERRDLVPIRIVVNRESRLDAALDVYRRLEQSCQQFLELTIHWLAHVPDDPRIAECAVRGEPCVEPASPIAEALLRSGAETERGRPATVPARWSG